LVKKVVNSGRVIPKKIPMRIGQRPGSQAIPRAVLRAPKSKKRTRTRIISPVIPLKEPLSKIDMGTKTRSKRSCETGFSQIRAAGESIHRLRPPMTIIRLKVGCSCKRARPHSASRHTRIPTPARAINPPARAHRWPHSEMDSG